MFRLVTICVILHITIGALATDSSSETWEFKLSEGASWLVSGRAMFRTNSTEEWGYVCSDVFKDNDYGPLAFCHSLGLLGITEARFIPAPRAVLDHSFLLDDVTCLENATFIQNCTHNPIGIHNCFDGNELSGVECTIPIESWEFRLVGGIGVEGNSTPTNGLVEMRPLPSLPWGSINNALFKRGSGNDTAALKAVCTTLGFNVTGITPILVVDVPYYSTGPSYLNPRYCYEGSDPYLQNCTMNILASSTWGATSQLAVECEPTWEFQLVNDVTPNPWEGRVIGRISKAMNFSRVCSDVLYTDALYSLCRSSGVTDAYYARKMPLGTYGLDPTIESESPYILSSLECTNPLSDIEKCKFNPLFSLSCGGADGQLNLRCPPFNVSEWQFRLRNTTSVATRGYFEINPYESIGEPWMYLTNCISASLACRQVGFSNWSYPPSVTYASPQSGMGSVGFMMSPSCSGNTFDTCRLNQGYYLRSFNFDSCSFYAAYLDCNTTKPPDPNATVATGGRVEVTVVVPKGVADEVFVAGVTIGSVATPLVLVETVSSIQMAAIFTVMPCSTIDGSMSHVLSPLQLSGTNASDLLGSFVLLVSISAVYMAVSLIVLRLARRFGSQEGDAADMRVFKAKLFLWYPRVPMTVAVLLLPGMSFESCSLLYGVKNGGPWWERVIGAAGLLVSLAIVAYHIGVGVVVGRIARKQLEENPTTNTAATEAPYVHDEAPIAKTTTPDDHHDAVIVFDYDDDAPTGDGCGIPDRDAYNNSTPATPQEHDKTARTTVNDNTKSKNDEVSTSIDGPQSSVYFVTYTEEAKARVPAILGTLLLATGRWNTHVLRSMRFVVVNCRRDVVSYVCAHNCVRIVLVSIVAAVDGKNVVECQAVQGNIAAICFIHALVILGTRVYRVPILTPLQAGQSICLGLLACAAFIQNANAQQAFVIIMMLLSLLTTILCGVVALLEMCVSRKVSVPADLDDSHVQK